MFLAREIIIIIIRSAHGFSPQSRASTVIARLFFIVNLGSGLKSVGGREEE
jgi:hypothetical protein